MNLDSYKEFLQAKKAELRYYIEKKDSLESELESLTKSCENIKEAKEIMSLVGVLSQSGFEKVIEDLVTKALQSIFGEGYSFEIENVISRNQPETYMYVVIDGERHLLKNADDELGFGVVDVVSFALRIVCWMVGTKKTSNMIGLD